jgi:hypothetical protein
MNKDEANLKHFEDSESIHRLKYAKILYQKEKEFDKFLKEVQELEKIELKRKQHN